jgi:uncharacterized protein (UPF0332 family)
MDATSKDLIQIKFRGRSISPHKAIVAPVIGARNVLTNSPWTYVALWLKRGGKDKALLYWQQAQEFHKVSLGLPPQSAPLLLYYSFLNATKALLSAKGIVFNERHGVSEHILRSRVQLTLVGDHRQATFRTNNSAKNSVYSGIKVIQKIREWEKVKLCKIAYQTETHRCNQDIANIADGFFPREPKTKSRNENLTGHDGVFAIHDGDVDAYIKRFGPHVLRLDVKTDCRGYEAMNFGESKGLTFERVLIFPHKLAQKWLSTGDIKHVEKSASKMYVGVSRARHSVAFVYGGALRVAGITRYSA